MHASSAAAGMDKSQVKAAAKHSASTRLVSTLKRALSGHSLFVAQAASTEVQEGGAASPGCDPRLPSECAAGVRVAILVDHAVAWGERVAVVGQDAVLGGWQASSCVPLAWSEGDVWRAELGLPPGLHEFKCVTIKSDGKLEWEVGSNRVIQVPAEAQAGGVLEARCRWADTANTTLASSDDGDAAVPTDSSTGRSSSSNASDAFRTCSSESADGTGIRSHQLAATASDCGESQRSSSCGGGATQTPSAAAAAAAVPRLPPQQPAPAGDNSRTLTAASLKEAAAAEAHGSSSSSGAAAGGVRRGGGAAVRPSSCMSSSPFSALTGPTAASSLLSPLGTDVTGALPGRGASSSALSYSDLEVSDEAALDESEAGGLTEEGLASSEVDAAEAVAAAAAGGMVLAEQQLLDNAAVYQQLMAVEPELLLQQQQQQLIQQQAEATLQAVRSVSSSPASGAFKGASPTTADAESQELLDAAAELCDLSSGVDAALLLPSEETLPPTALTKFAALAEIQEGSDDEEQLELEEYSSSTYAAAAGPGGMDADALPDVPPARRDSSSSSSSRLSKDQLPILGLTVNVPSAAAAAAAQMSAANQAAAAAAAAAAKARPSYTGEAPELPVATEGLRLTGAAHCIPHVDKAHTGGEDAFFISSAGHGALGVSDGVSAWAEDGIDPGEYSRTLAAYCAEAYEERVIAAAAAASSGGFISRFDPRALLRYAQQCTCKPGSATMVLASLQPGGQLHVANLGDCGVKVVRQGRVVLETKPQQHDFNLPYQLSHPQLFPDTDTADSADRYTWQLQEGDVIVAASDGLFDNMWDDELVALLQQGLLGVQPLEPPASLRRTDSLSSIGGSTRGAKKAPGRHSRSSSTSQLPALTSAPSTGSLPVFAASAAAAEEGGADARPGGMPRSRSTSQLSNWGAKQLRKWKGGASHSKLVSLPATAEAADAAAAAAQGGEQQRPQSPAEVGPDAIARAAELLAAAAAAHAGDKEFKSPWSVAAGRAYGLLARLFAKGGKMDDITCVVAVVQDAARAAAAAGGQPLAAAASDASGSAGSGSRDQGKGSSGSSDSSSIGAPCLTSEGSGVSAAAIDELQ